MAVILTNIVKFFKPLNHPLGTKTNITNWIPSYFLLYQFGSLILHVFCMTYKLITNPNKENTIKLILDNLYLRPILLLTWVTR